VIKDKNLLIFVFGCLLSVWLYLAIWTGIDRKNLTVEDSESDPMLQYRRCSSNTIGFDIALIGIEVIWLFFGVALCWKTRKVSILRFNESAHINLCIYNILFLGIVLIPISYLLDVEHNIQFILISVGILLASFGIIFTLFSPKIWAIIRNKPIESFR